MAAPTVYLSVDRAECKRKNEEVCYEIWVPGGDSVRLVWHNEEWTLVHPFETWTSHDEGPPATSKRTHPLRVCVDKKDFRSHVTRTHKDKVPLVTEKGLADAPVDIAREPMNPHSRSAAHIVLYTSLTDTPVAFGLNAYSLEPTSTSGGKRKVWSWTSAAVVPWSHLIKTCPRPMAFKTFMWSDMRMNTNVVGMSELLIVHSEDVSAYEINRRDLVRDVRTVTEYVKNEFDALFAMRFSPDTLKKLRNSEEQMAVRNSTFNTTLDGLAYAVPDETFGGDPMPEEFMGSSAQSWYYYTKPVVTKEWLVQKLSQVAHIHAYDVSANYARDVDVIVRGGGWDDETKTQKLLTDVIRICTMHATSSPYVPDERTDPVTGKTLDSDSYSSALKVPGDCEDGAHSAYMIYMSILFGDWESERAYTDKWTRRDRDVVVALKKLAAYLGFPICVTGTAANPMKPSSAGGTHAYGCVVPFPRFLKALFGPSMTAEDEDAAYAKFERRFGYAYPRRAEPLEVSAIETTLFSTPLVGHHQHPPAERELYEILKKFAMEEMYERHCAAINFMYTFVLEDDCQCHLMAIKGFTTAHRELFYSEDEDDRSHLRLHPRRVDGSECKETYSCTFAFWRPDGHIGVHRDELYRMENDCGWELRVPVEMDRKTWEADLALVQSCRAPFQPLVARVVDPQKPHDVNALLAAKYIDAFRYDEPHVMVFVYDATHVYPDGKSVGQKMKDLAAALGARRYATSLYDKCLVIVFSDFVNG